jgi:hypothetical protein
MHYHAQSRVLHNGKCDLTHTVVISISPYMGAEPTAE